jgi:acyl-CoA thioesterase II
MKDLLVRPLDESSESDGMLTRLLTLEDIEVDLFRAAETTGGSGRLLGGQVAAQAMTAAGCTVTGARPHSLHAYFLRPGDSSWPILFRVERLHDGRTFHRRRVTAIQDGHPILCLESSFTADAPVADDYPGMPAVPAPEDCPVFVNPGRLAGLSQWSAIEARSVDGVGLPMPRAMAGDMWIRLLDRAVTDDVPAESVLTYLSDLTLAAATVRPTERHPNGRPEVLHLVSLDHSVWFHNEARLSDWLLYTKALSTAGARRGLATGQLFNQDGTLVATVAQETLMR